MNIDLIGRYSMLFDRWEYGYFLGTRFVIMSIFLRS